MFSTNHSGAGDTTPDSFSITAVSNAEPSTQYTRNIVPTGFNAATTWSVSGGNGTGQGSVAGGAYSASGVISPGQTLTLRATASASFLTGTTLTVVIGTVSATWTLTTREGDAAPGSFTITDVSGAEPDTEYSASVVPSGYEVAVAWSVSGGNGTGRARVGTAGVFTTSGTISPGQTLNVKGTAGSTSAGAVNFNVTIGGVTDIWSITTRTLDTAPDAFSILDYTGVERSTQYSRTITPAGFDYQTSWSISGGAEAAVAGGATYAASGTISPGQTFTVRATASANYSTTTNYTVTIGGVSDVWSLTTRAIDSTPDGFTLSDLSNLEPSTSYTTTVTPSGYEATVAWSISGGNGTGEGSVAGGAYATSGSIAPGQTLSLRGQSSGTSQGSLNFTVTIGGVSDIWTLSTRILGSTPSSFSGLITNFSGTEPSSEQAMWFVPSGYETSVSWAITGGNATGTGIAAAAPSGQGSSGTGTTTGTYTTSGTISPGQALWLKATAANTFSASSVFTVTIGGVSATWSVSTRARDGDGDFSFTSVTGAEAYTLYSTATVTATGFEPSSVFSVTVTGGEADAGTSALSGTFAASKSVTTSSTGTFVLRARLTTGALASTPNTNTCTVTVGSTVRTFSVTTRAADTTPDVFLFPAANNVEPNTLTTSATITVTGLEPNFTHMVSATGGTVDVNIVGTTTLTGVFESSKGVTTDSSGRFLLAARRTSDVNFGGGNSVAVTIMSTTSYFYINVRNADTSGTITFPAASGVERNTTQTSSTVTASGFEPNYTFTVTGTSPIDVGTSALSGTFATSKTVTTSATGTFVIAARVTTGSLFSTDYSNTITAGNTTTSYTASTRAADTTPAAFSFTAATNQEPSTYATSNTITVSGLEPSYTVSVYCSGNNAQVDAGTSALSGTFSSSKTVTTSASGTIVVAGRFITGSAFSTAYSMTVTVESTSATFTATTRAIDDSGTLAFQSDVVFARNLPNTSATATASGFEPNATMTVTAAGVTVDVGTTSLSGTFASSKTATTNALGQFLVAARVTSSPEFSTATTVTVTAGTTQATYTVTTRNAVITPDAASFAAISNAEPNATVTSATVTLTGLEPSYALPVAFMATNGTVDAGTTTLSGTFSSSKFVTTSASGTVVVALRTTSTTFLNFVTTTLTLGGTTWTWTVTTRAADKTPNAFSFVSTTNAELNSTPSSALVTITGLEPNHGVYITAVNGSFVAGATDAPPTGPFFGSNLVTTSATGSLLIRAAATASGNYSTSTTATINVGTGQATYTVTTRAIDTTPNAFTFTDYTGQEPGTLLSTVVTLTGLEPSSTLNITASFSGFSSNAGVRYGTASATGSFLQFNNSPALSLTPTTTASGTFVLELQMQASASFSTTINGTVTIGGVSDVWTVATRAGDTTPNAFSFTNVDNINFNTLVTAAPLTISGLEPSYPITLAYTSPAGAAEPMLYASSVSSSTGMNLIANGGSASTNSSGQLFISFQAYSATTGLTARNYTVYVGSGSAVWTIITRLADVTGTAPNFNTVSPATLSTQYTSNTITVSGLEPNYTLEVFVGLGAGVPAATVDVGTTALSGLFAAEPRTVTTSASGTFVVALRATSASSAATLYNYQLLMRDPANTSNSSYVSGSVWNIQT